MSVIVRDRTGDQEVRRLACDIINTQASQRGMLLGQLDAWGLPAISRRPMMWMPHARPYRPRDGSLMVGMATNTQLARLRAAKGRRAEVLYLQLMTEHHRGGITMAQAAVQLARTELIKDLAQGMVQSQRSEIKLMADMLGARNTRPRARPP